jgi:hypothetical protein
MENNFNSLYKKYNSFLMALMFYQNENRVIRNQNIQNKLLKSHSLPASLKPIILSLLESSKLANLNLEPTLNVNLVPYSLDFSCDAHIWIRSLGREITQEDLSLPIVFKDFERDLEKYKDSLTFEDYNETVNNQYQIKNPDFSRVRQYGHLRLRNLCYGNVGEPGFIFSINIGGSCVPEFRVLTTESEILKLIDLVFSYTGPIAENYHPFGMPVWQDFLVEQKAVEFFEKLNSRSNQ